MMPLKMIIPSASRGSRHEGAWSRVYLGRSSICLRILIIRHATSSKISYTCGCIFSLFKPLILVFSHFTLTSLEKTIILGLTEWQIKIILECGPLHWKKGSNLRRSFPSWVTLLIKILLKVMTSCLKEWENNFLGHIFNG